MSISCFVKLWMALPERTIFCMALAALTLPGKSLLTRAPGDYPERVETARLGKTNDRLNFIIRRNDYKAVGPKINNVVNGLAVGVRKCFNILNLTAKPAVHRSWICRHPGLCHIARHGQPLQATLTLYCTSTTAKPKIKSQQPQNYKIMRAIHNPYPFRSI